jgi:hypothetical protein
VCSNGSGTCILAYDHVYEVYVTEWGDNTDICWDSIPGDCLADVYFRMYFGGELICSSSVVEDASWASWNEPCAIAFNETDPWSLIFRDYDALSPDDPVGVHAFAQPDGSPGPVPVEFLHAGGAIWGDATTAFTVTVTFVPK